MVDFIRYSRHGRVPLSTPPENEPIRMRFEKRLEPLDYYDNKLDRIGGPFNECLYLRKMDVFKKNPGNRQTYSALLEL